MEPISQALLGAAVGEVAAGRRLGRRALLWGAVLGAAPDLDVLAAPLHGGFGEWLYHRGTTHSLWFGFVAGPVLGWGLWRWRDPERRTPLAAWVGLAVLALVTHPLLDGFTAYGTQLFAPFWRERFAWNGVGIVDPIYTLPLALGVAAAATTRGTPAFRRRALHAGLAVSTLYLAAGVALNEWAETRVEAALEREGRSVARVRVYPTVLQPFTRHFVAWTDAGAHVGWHSLLAPDCPVWRVRDEPRTPRVEALLATWEGGVFAWFADHEIGFEEQRTRGGFRVRLDDLRYAWGGEGGRGMWGVEADFDVAGRRLGPVRRFERRATAGRSASQLLAILGGRLPDARQGFASRSACGPAGTLAGAQAPACRSAAGAGAACRSAGPADRVRGRWTRPDPSVPPRA